MALEFCSSRPKPSGCFVASSSAAVKKSPTVAAISSSTWKNARPVSSSVMAPSAMKAASARPASSSLLAPSAVKARTPSSSLAGPSAKNAHPTSSILMAPSAKKAPYPSSTLMAPPAKKARLTSSSFMVPPDTKGRPLSSSLMAPPPSSTHMAPSAKKAPPRSSILMAPSAKKACRSSEFMAPPDAQTVHPIRRLKCGTAVQVRTRCGPMPHKMWLVLWLPARVVSASDAYHYTVKYAADVSPKFAGKLVHVPVEHVRERPRHVAAAATAPPQQSKKRPAPEQEELANDCKRAKRITGRGIPQDALERFWKEVSGEELPSMDELLRETYAC